jgi:hypothetical protein
VTAIVERIAGAIERQPIRFAMAIGIAIDLAVSLGLALSADQVVLLNGLVMAVLAWLLPDKVTPVAAPQLPIGTAVTVTDAQGVATTTKTL